MKKYKTKHPYYETWSLMKKRCYLKSHIAYDRYGGRGISVCRRWLNDFWSFVEDMGDRPVSFTLDRVDNDGNYCPENCKWSSRQEQALNRRKRKNQKYPKGIRRYKKSNKYGAEIWISGCFYFIGSFDTLKEAKNKYSEMYFEWYGVYPKYND